MKFVLFLILGVVLLTIAQTALIEQNADWRNRETMSLPPLETDASYEDLIHITSEETDESSESPIPWESEDLRELLENIRKLGDVFSFFLPSENGPESRMINNPDVDKKRGFTWISSKFNGILQKIRNPSNSTGSTK